MEGARRELNDTREELAGSRVAAKEAERAEGAAVEARDVFRQQVWRKEGVSQKGIGVNPHMHMHRWLISRIGLCGREKNMNPS